MPLSTAAMQSWLKNLLGGNRAQTHRPLEEFLRAIPRLESLSGVPSGTPVLVRGDLDCKPGETVGEGDVRLRSMKETLQYGIERGWRQVIFGHIGRKPEGSLDKVAKRLGEIVRKPITLIPEWLDESTVTIRDEATSAIRGAAPGSLIMLENARKYAIERVLWEAAPGDAAKLAEKLAKLANEFAQKIADVYVNEALSAGSLDCSSTVVPAAMRQGALGKYVAGEFDGPMLRCLRATLVVFSGLKADKLDDLQAVVARGQARMVIVAGSLAMALKKAEAELAGQSFCIGAAENPSHESQPYYVSRTRINQARDILRTGRENKVRFVLPIDFVLADGRVTETLSPDDQQLDVGPRSSQVFSQAVGQYLELLSREPSLAKVAFHNGVFGKFEDAKFQEGTKKFVAEFKRLKDAGMEVYVGGGEGGTALEMFGRPDFVTHCFTAGGTVLNALGSEPVPFLLALKMAAGRLESHS
ncbi:MAG: phosphoglycerate kinase [Planctomycetia bacterium]|nr:phosphoglycerate kinase [Planctomycetia bacterium]